VSYINEASNISKFKKGLFQILDWKRKIETYKHFCPEPINTAKI